MIRVAINGFGRIGRCVLRILEERAGVEVVGVNDLADLGDLAYLLKYDSVHGWYPRKVDNRDGKLIVDDRTIGFFSERDPAALPWGDLGVDVVVESTGIFRDRAKAALHQAAGARKVIISAPSKNADGMFVLGVNSDQFDADKHSVVSMASCTTNCLAPVAKVINDTFGIEDLMFTTVHAYTSSQSLMDQPTRKRRRGRSAALSIIPTTTGAAEATEIVIPALAGRMTGMAMRVPTPDGSVTDMVIRLNRDATVEDINDALRDASEMPDLHGVLRVTDEALVSRDIIGDPHSSIVDSEMTMVMRGRVAKLFSWYDNEWGYSSRLADFTEMIGKS